MTFALSLALTLVIEEGVALLWGLRGRDLLLCAMVKVVTNPLAVLGHLLAPGWLPLLALAGAAVAAEGACYRRYGLKIASPWGLAICANLISFSLGLALDKLI